MRWSDKRDNTSEKVYFADVYEEALMAYKDEINKMKIVDTVNMDNTLKAVLLTLSREKFRDMEFEIYQLGHEIGFPNDQIAHDIESARRGGKVRKVFRWGGEDKDGDPIQIRKRKMNKIKPKRKIIKNCRCKK